MSALVIISFACFPPHRSENCLCPEPVEPQAGYQISHLPSRAGLTDNAAEAADAQQNRSGAACNSECGKPDIQYVYKTRTVAWLVVVPVNRPGCY